jgi:hypothetical protein
MILRMRTKIFSNKIIGLFKKRLIFKNSYNVVKFIRKFSLNDNELINITNAITREWKK